MDNNAHPPGQAAPLPDPNSIAALEAFERLSLQSQTPVKNASSSSRPSTSNGAPTGAARLDSLAQGNALRRSSSSLAQPGSQPSPELHKRLSMNSLRGIPSPSSPRFSASRRSSSGIPVRPLSSMSFASTVVPEEPPKPRTAATVGAEYFAKELAAHAEAEKDTETLVIIHEACYGHRFSRPKTTKSALSMIVERPERITAAVLGLSTAYVRLGSRHTGGLNPPAPTDVPVAPLPFAIRRSSRAVGLLSPQVTTVHGTDWMSELQAMCLAAGARLALDGKELLRPQRIDAAGNPVQSQAFHEGDLYLCAESLDALQGAVGGVCDAVDAVFSASLTRRAFVAVRPPGHHCSADFPSGFCWLNNVHVGIQYAAQTYGLTHAVILDFDLHHGDGSQDITWDLNEKSAAMPKNAPHHKKISIGYYSLHDINSYPCEMGDKDKVQNASLCIDNAHGQSIWNVHLEPWRSEEEFSGLYESKYRVILDKARAFLQKQTAKIRAVPKGGKPKAAVFISAGFDASQWEGAGMQRHAVNVPTSFYERFTRDAVKLAQDDATAAEGRVISVLEGGYSDRALTSGVLSHVTGLCQKDQAHTNGNAVKVENADYTMIGDMRQAVQMTNPRWWNSEALTALESYTAAEIPALKRPSRGFIPTFASPTESFSQKVVDPDKFYRSMSGTMRPLPEPPLDLIIPPVDWIAASHALCKLLIPAHRTTTSCRPEELAAPKTKKQRQSLGPVATVEPVANGRQLRDRKAKPAENGGLFSEDDARQRANRRKTMADVPQADPSELTRPKRASRRSSAASGVDMFAQPKSVPDVPAIPASFVQQQEKSTPKQTIAKGRKKSPAKGKVTTTPPPPTPPPAAQPDPSLKALLPPANFNHPPTDSTPTPPAQNLPPVPPPALTTESSQASFTTAPSSVPPSSAASTIGSDPLDGLTSGIKRITLKLGTREEHDRRFAAQLAAQAEAEAMTTSQASDNKKASDMAEAAVKDGRRRPRKLAAKAKKFETAGDGPIAPPGIPGSGAEDGPGGGVQQTFRPAGVANMIARGERSGSRVRRGGSEEPRPVSRKGEEMREMEGVDMGNAAIGAPITEAIARDVAASRSGPNLASQVPQPKEAIGFTHSTEPGNGAQPLLDKSNEAVPQHTAASIQADRDLDATPRPSTQGQRGKLPVFSSTGAIPFGVPPPGPAAVAAPDTVMGLAPGGGWDGNGVSRSMLSVEDGDGSRSVTPNADLTGNRGTSGEKDIWEVPETPAKR
ncbi:Histone deacetylase-like protein [Elsinoe fawcettii]|nr:Histone deacetylase-like protein [Elsinoe fawcettii]